MSARFLQLHSLTSYPSALLNRDDAGFAKRIPFGGAIRTRISSQCLKRHWRTFEGQSSLRDLELPGSIRSRITFERFVFQPLVEQGVDEALAEAVVRALMNEVLGESARARTARAESDESERTDLRTGQVTVLGRPEVEFLLEEARAICGKVNDPAKAATEVKSHLGREGRKNLQALRHASGLDAALFGRMVTSDILSRGDAAIHVAHAFTVHGEAAESDYFAAVDDLLQETEEEMGSGHIGATELTSGLFYGYLVIDVPLLVSNLEGCPRGDWREADSDLAGAVVERFVRLVATVSPGAKLGSTAPYAYAHLLLAEAGEAQPRTLANAFLRPIPDGADLVAASYRSLADHLGDLDRMYGRGTTRQLAALHETEAAEVASAIGAGNVVSLEELATWTAQQVRS